MLVGWRVGVGPIVSLFVPVVVLVVVTVVLAVIVAAATALPCAAVHRHLRPTSRPESWRRKGCHTGAPPSDACGTEEGMTRPKSRRRGKRCHTSGAEEGMSAGIWHRQRRGCGERMGWGGGDGDAGGNEEGMKRPQLWRRGRRCSTGGAEKGMTTEIWRRQRWGGGNRFGRGEGEGGWDGLLLAHRSGRLARGAAADMHGRQALGHVAGGR